MWHVDEGALHAYLDGALDEYPGAEARRVREHLETCAECADRLAEERRVRDEAQEILGLAAPEVEVPTFEELRAYVRAQQPARTMASVRLYRLSWAASVVLALGTGWLLRGGVPPTTLSSGGTAFDADRTVTGEAAPAEAPAAPTVESSNDAPAASRQAAASSTPEASVAETAAAPAEPRAEVAGTPAETLDEIAVTDGRAALADASDVDPAGSTASDDTVELLAANARVVVPELAPISGAVARQSQTSTDSARQDTATRAVEADRTAAAEQRLRSAITAPAPAAGLGGGVSTLGRAAASDLPPAMFTDEDSTSLVVPGLEVLDVLPVGQGTTFAGMRALQRLQTGDTLELVHLPEAIDPASLPPLRSGWSEIVRARGSGWLVMRAPVPEASLIELLQRLEHGR
jgi:hypothetical protein